eukprot:1619009-Rhodomonas_salina.1
MGERGSGSRLKGVGESGCYGECSGTLVRVGCARGVDALCRGACTGLERRHVCKSGVCSCSGSGSAWGWAVKAGGGSEVVVQGHQCWPVASAAVALPVPSQSC